MIVKYKTGKIANTDFGMNENYLVFGVEFSSKNCSQKLILCRDSDKTPILVNFSDFVLVDSRLPNNWCLLYFNEGDYVITPQEFQGDFWDDFHDGNKNTERIFTDVKEQLELFHQSVEEVKKHLLAELTQCVALLRPVNETYWADKIENSFQNKKLDVFSLATISSWYAENNNPSFKQLVIAERYGHFVDQDSEKKLNDELNKLRKGIYQKITRLQNNFS
jgi:hypothetical protein